MSILHNIFFFIVSIGVLVTFHEFGHYWVCLLYTSDAADEYQRV